MEIVISSLILAGFSSYFDRNKEIFYVICRWLDIQFSVRPICSDRIRLS